MAGAVCRLSQAVRDAHTPVRRGGQWRGESEDQGRDGRMRRLRRQRLAVERGGPRELSRPEDVPDDGRVSESSCWCIQKMHNFVPSTCSKLS